MEIIGGYAFGYIERYEALVKHIAKKKKEKNSCIFYRRYAIIAHVNSQGCHSQDKSDSMMPPE